MLVELRVRDLGVIAGLDLVLGPGLTALTGETGAGKTLVVEALELLIGGRADPALVRAGAGEALVEGRFVTEAAAGTAGQGSELVLARGVPASGRSRAYLDGRMAPLAALGELGRDLVDLYGQHAHQSLLRPGAQREALDRFAGVDLAPLQAERRSLAALERRIDGLGGDARSRLRELDLLRFELGEIEQAGIASALEDEELAAEEERLAHAAAVREAAWRAYAALAAEGGGGARELLGEAVAALGQLAPLAAGRARLAALAVEVEDAASDLRLAAERAEEDPARLAEVRSRRQLLRGLVRKHGDGLADVLKVAELAAARIAELEATDSRLDALEAERAGQLAAVGRAEREVGRLRRRAAPALATAVERHLRQLALPGARLEVRIGEGELAEEVEVLLGANRGEPALPLAKAASGGELARAMLALRLVLTSSPPTLVFDEVDAGIGGQAAIAVGQALAELAVERQVLVVTHLPQVAAYAAHHVVVTKQEQSGRTLTAAGPVEGEDRVGELSRMLAGRPGSAAARRHAEELLAEAAVVRRALGASL